MQNVIRLAKRNFIFSEILETAPKNLKRSNRKKNANLAGVLFLLNVNLAGVLFLL